MDNLPCCQSIQALLIFGLLVLFVPMMANSQDPPAIPKLVAKEFPDDFIPAYLSNGFIGLRPRPNPLEISQTVVAGFAMTHSNYNMEALSAAPYPFAVDFIIDGENCPPDHKGVKIIRQTLDMATGELFTEMKIEISRKKTLAIDVLQFASRSVPSLICQQIRLQASQDMIVEIIPSIDYSKKRREYVHNYNENPIPLSVYFRKTPYYENVALMAGFQSQNKLGIAVYIDEDEPFKKSGKGEKDLSQPYKLDAKSGKNYEIRMIAAMVSEIYHREPEQQAVRMAGWGKSIGFKRLRADNQKAWNELWKSRVKDYGDPEAQKGLDAAFFYLMSSVHPGAKTGLAPFGLSQYENYFGHIFWDMDTWMFVPVLLVSPNSARSLLENRVNGLQAAKDAASLFGYQGAHYSWEASLLDGIETTPANVATGWAQHHSIPDVGIAFWEYQMATGDQLFLHDGSWPVLKEIARWIESRGFFTKRGYEIHDVMGPDESLENIVNNSYVNVTCKMAMEAAIKCAKQVGIQPPSSWQKIADSMVVPLNEELKIVLPYDNPPSPKDKEYSYGQMQYLYLHHPPVDDEYVKNTHFYEKQCIYRNEEDYPWPEWNVAHVAAPYAVMEALYGDKEMALTLFEVAWKPFALGPFLIPTEFRKANWGAFITSNGSLLHSAMVGFTGLRITEGDWCLYPASLPKGWKRIEIDRIWVNGKPKKLIAIDGKKSQLLDVEQPFK